MEPCNCGDPRCARCLFGEPISSYTRADALADGTLIDVSAAAREVGVVYPVALTAAVWSRCVQVPEGVVGQDERGRLHDIVWMLRCEIRRSGGGESEIRFRLHVRDSNREGTPPLVELRAVCGPGDGGEPVITVLLREED